MRLRLGRDAVLVSVMVYGEAGLTSVVLVSPMVLWSGSLPSRVLRHLYLEGPIPSGAVGWILALLGERGGPAEVTPGVRQGWSSAPCGFPRGGAGGGAQGGLRG